MLKKCKKNNKKEFVLILNQTIKMIILLKLLQIYKKILKMEVEIITKIIIKI